MGASRSDEKSQRAYLGKLAAKFERIVGCSLNAYYTEDEIFNDRLDMRLITRVIGLNEVFSEVFSQRGHTRNFEHSHKKNGQAKQLQLQLLEIEFDMPDDAALDLDDIIRTERFHCPEPLDDSIMEHIDDIFQESRGPELGTVSGKACFDGDHVLMVHSLAAPCLERLSRSNPNDGKISSCPTSVMRSCWCTTSSPSFSATSVPTSK